MEFTLNGLRSSPQEIFLTEVLTKEIHIEFEAFPGGRLALNGDVYRPVTVNRLFDVGGTLFREQPTIPVASRKSILQGNGCVGIAIAALDDYTRVRVNLVEDVPQAQAGFLDGFPNGVAFSVEQAYTGTYNPIVNDGPLVARLNSNNLAYTFNANGLIFTAGGYIYGEETSTLASGETATIPADSLVALVARKTFDGQSDIIDLPANNSSITALTNGRIRFRRNTLNNNQAIFTSPSDSFRLGEFFLVTCRTSPTQIEGWINGVPVGSDADSNPIRDLSGQFILEMNRTDFKFGALWAGADIPNVDELNAFLMQHYQISP